MRKKQGLLGQIEKGSLVSPLVDVVFNLMITMFVFLMIYMAVVIPRDVKMLHFATDVRELVEAKIYEKYKSNIPVAGGSGRYAFVFADDRLTILRAIQESNKVFSQTGSRKSPKWNRLVIPGKGEIFDEVYMEMASGMVNGKFRDRENKAYAVYLDVVVVDTEHKVSRPLESCEALCDSFLFFHETQKDSNHLKASKSVVAHPAIRSTFSITVKPRAVPFDPAKSPLNLTAPAYSKLMVGIPFEMSPVAVGGIEPYEFALEPVRERKQARWLQFDSASGRIYGTPHHPGEFSFILQLKDAQTLKGNWRAAKEAQHQAGRPYVEQPVILEVSPYEPLSVSLTLPMFGRCGEPLESAAVAAGGFGKKHFIFEGLPPGLDGDAVTGKIVGAPAQEGIYKIKVGVKDEHPEKEKSMASTEKDWRVLPPRPPAKIVGPWRQQ